MKNTPAVWDFYLKTVFAAINNEEMTILKSQSMSRVE